MAEKKNVLSQLFQIGFDDIEYNRSGFLTHFPWTNRNVASNRTTILPVLLQRFGVHVCRLDHTLLVLVQQHISCAHHYSLHVLHVMLYVIHQHDRKGQCTWIFWLFFHRLVAQCHYNLGAIIQHCYYWSYDMMKHVIVIFPWTYCKESRLGVVTDRI